MGDDRRMSEQVDVGLSQARPAGRGASHYARGTAANMVRSLLVIGALMAGLFFAVARTNTVSVPQVDVDAMARQVVANTGWPIEVARDLPDGWTVSAVRFATSTDGLKTWHVGYQTEDRKYVAVEQTIDASAGWVRAQTNRAPITGSVSAGGREWAVHVRDQKVQNSLVNDPPQTGRLTTLLTGDGSVADLQVLAEHLQGFTT